jgi:hypothetical protein
MGNQVRYTSLSSILSRRLQQTGDERISKYVRMEVVEVDGKCFDKILATPIPSDPSQDPRRLNRKPESTRSLASTWPGRCADCLPLRHG